MRYLLILLLSIFLFSSCLKSVDTDISEQKLENYTAFAKLYGYIRFYYPSDEAAKLDWNKFAVYGAMYVEDAKDSKELRIKLNELFFPVAPLLKIYEKGEIVDTLHFAPPNPSELKVIIWKHLSVGGIGLYGSSNISYKSVRGINNCESSDDVFCHVQKFPKPDELFRADINNALSIIMPLALYKDYDGTLPRLSNSNTETISDFIKSSLSDTFSANNKYVRLANITICWNVFQHFYPYFEVVKIDWKAELKPALVEAIVDTSEYDFLMTLKKLTAKLEDGHLFVKHNSDFHNSYYPPFCWQWIENKIVITKVFDEAEEKIKAGDIVVEINAVPALDALLKEEQYVSGATTQWKRNYYTYSGINTSTMRLLSGERHSLMKLKIKRDDQFIDLEFKRTLLSANYETNDLASKEIKPGIFYVNLTNIGNGLENMPDKLKNAKGIVFDIRGYPTGVPHYFLRHLTKKNLKCAQWLKPINLYPDQKNTEYNTDGRWDVIPAEPYLNAKIAFITDGRAISYAETVMGIVEYYKLGEIIGEPTAGTNGGANVLYLPGDYEISWTGMKVLKHDGSQHHGIGILPTIPVPRTIQSIKEGRDIQLEKAIEVVSK